jgi:hypothetical protein
MALIEIDCVTKHFGPVRAVDDLSFALDPGTITGFLGPNGAASADSPWASAAPRPRGRCSVISAFSCSTSRRTAWTPRAYAGCRDLLRALRAEGGTIVLSRHVPPTWRRSATMPS